MQNVLCSHNELITKKTYKPAINMQNLLIYLWKGKKKRNYYGINDAPTEEWLFVTDFSNSVVNNVFLRR